MPKQKPDAGEIEARLKSITDYVQDCERRVIMGEIMDLQGLDKNVIEVCDALANMPPAEARALEEKMARLIEKLEVLAGSMKQQQEKYQAAGAG
jgi:hypothetical protein